MAKELVRRIEKIEQQIIPIGAAESGLFEMIFGASSGTSKEHSATMLQRAMVQIDGGARLIPGGSQIVSKGLY